MRNRRRRVTAPPQRLRQSRKRRRSPLGQSLPALARTQTLRVRHRPCELVAARRVRQVLQRKLVRLAHAVGPVGAEAEPRHVGDDQKRRVLQRQRVLPQLVEGGVEVGAPALVFPGEAVALPHIGPALAARILARAALEAIGLPRRVRLRRRRLAQQPAQVDEVLLRRRALLQRRRAPLRDKRPRRHSDADIFVVVRVSRTGRRDVPRIRERRLAPGDGRNRFAAPVMRPPFAVRAARRESPYALFPRPERPVRRVFLLSASATAPGKPSGCGA